MKVICYHKRNIYRTFMVMFDRITEVLRFSDDLNPNKTNILNHFDNPNIWLNPETDDLEFLIPLAEEVVFQVGSLVKINGILMVKNINKIKFQEI